MNETHCCLWDYTINFKEDYGWDWIIHPKEYKANFCQGECSYHTMMPSNSYAHLMAQVGGRIRISSWTPTWRNDLKMGILK